MKSLYILVFVSLCAALCVVPSSFVSTATAKDNIEVIRDKDKTSYVIESDDQAARDEERDKEKAWQMLQNSNLWIGGRGRPPATGSANQ